MYGYSESRSAWWRTMAAALMPGREPTEREARSPEALNRCARLCPSSHVYNNWMLRPACAAMLAPLPADEQP